VTFSSKYRFYFLTGLLAVLVTQLNAQENNQTVTDFYKLKDYFDHSYGADYNLWNGKEYYIRYYNTEGHPFFNSDQFRKGSLLINGIRYEDVTIKYDLVDQHIILQQTAFSGIKVHLVLTSEFIDEFTIDGKLFRRMSFPETGTRFFQIVRTSELPCFLFWEKDVIFIPSSYTTFFTPQSSKAYLMVSDRLNSIKNASSFIRIFGKQFRGEIRRFKRRNRINFRNISEESLKELINYCTSLADDKL